MLERTALVAKKKSYIDYLHFKANEQDWHAVWDIAVELYLIDKQLNDPTLL